MDKESLKKSLELTKRNKIAVICYTVTIIILSVAYLVETIKHTRSVPYFIVFMLLLWIPGIFILVFNKLKSDSHVTRYLILFGFAIPWGYALLTATSDLVFT
ncbi:MAG: hypothetical protein J5515_05185, partial [Lachnospiraceae bacterium]|nr:hypothetical protein [Lachnospiraceae bacterium]